MNDREAIAWTVEYVKDDRDAGGRPRHLSAYLEDPKGPTLCLLEACRRRASTRTRRPDPSSDVSSSSRVSSRGRRGSRGAGFRVGAASRDRDSREPRGRRVDAHARVGGARGPRRRAWTPRRIGSRVASPWLGTRTCRSATRQDWCLHTADVFSRALRDNDQLLGRRAARRPRRRRGRRRAERPDAALGNGGQGGSLRAEVVNPGAYRARRVQGAPPRGVCGRERAPSHPLEQGALLGHTTAAPPKEATRAATAAFGAGTRRPGRFGCCVAREQLVGGRDGASNPYADALLGQPGGGRAPRPALREPALRHLELCVKKVFTLLLTEARKLGAETCTWTPRRSRSRRGRRARAAAARGRGSEPLRRRELFSWLEPEPTRQWHAGVQAGRTTTGG